jgi:murein DD-endopeptidase MepM/ murein hydrolase activator NlpD
MKKKRKVMELLSNFVAGQGFYIVLILCVAIIGISGYYLYSTLSKGVSEVAATANAQISDVEAAAKSIDPEDAEEATVGQTDTKNLTGRSKTSTTTSTASKTSDGKGTSQQESKVPSTAATVFTWPVKGDVITDFSVDALAYDATMGDWRTHSGVDIEAGLGDQVKAAADGTVTASYEDDLMGTTLVIDHGGGLESIYSNLAASPAASIGDQVTTGDIIGSVGKTAIAESAKSPHLHFEMTLNGVSVNPQTYLP